MLEGVWGSTVDHLLEEIIRRQEFNYDKVSVCIPPPPFNGIRGWTYALTENMRLWREHDEQNNKITLYQHGVWSSYAFAKALVGDSQLEQDEIDLFREMTEGIAEVHELPDVIVFCHDFPKASLQRLEERESVLKDLSIEDLQRTSTSLIEWLDVMINKGVKVVEIPPPYKNDIESWTRSALVTLKEVFNNYGVDHASRD